ncbi:DUF4190 domain-containing protein [Bacillus songklensis]|uniref:DUF4190 domain-containing protein n=1 Tax=Bacillus songklensis TaxID=1069116 RepID=A0ABV8AYA6_9BACI
MEETAAEVAAPVPARGERIERNRTDHEREGAGEGRGYGILALVLSILSLFFMPVLLGAAGVILGFIARRRGANSLGAWAIGIGIVSIVIGVFILPFF